MGATDTLAGLVAPYEEAAREPEAWTARRVLVHVLRKAAQHAGHADVVRESLVGASTTAALAEEPGYAGG